MQAGIKEQQLILFALAAANAITRTPITKENIKEAKRCIESMEGLFDDAINERMGNKRPISGKV